MAGFSAAQINIIIRAQDNASKTMRGIGGAGDAMGKAIRRGALVAGAALIATGGLSIKMAINFDASMTKIITLVGLSEQAVAGMREEVLALAGSTARAPQELAEALFVVTSAGIRGAEAIEILERSAKAAAVGLGQTKDIARTVTAALQAYAEQGLTAAEATDILLTTVREGNLEAADLAGSLGRVLGIASQVGATFDEVGAFIATFTRLGVSAEEAVTALRGTLNSLIKPTTEAREALAEAGLSMADLRQQLEEEGLLSVLELLMERFGGNIEQLATIIPNIRALSGVLGTVGAQGEAYNVILDSIAESQGNLDEAFKRTAATPLFKLQQAFADIKVELIEVGSEAMPAVARAAEKVSETVRDVGPKIVQAIKDWKPVIEEAADAFRSFAQFIINNRVPLVAALVAIGVAFAWAMPVPTVIALGILGIAAAVGILRGDLEALSIPILKIRIALGKFILRLIDTGDIILSLGARLLPGIGDAFKPMTKIVEAFGVSLEDVQWDVGMTERQLAELEGQASVSRFGDLMAAQADGATFSMRELRDSIGDVIIAQGALAGLKAAVQAVPLIESTAQRVASITQNTQDMIDEFKRINRELDSFGGDGGGGPGPALVASFEDTADEVARVAGEAAEKAIIAWIAAIEDGVRAGTMIMEDATRAWAGGLQFTGDEIVRMLAVVADEADKIEGIMADAIERGFVRIQDVAGLLDLGAAGREAAEDFMAAMAGRQSDIGNAIFASVQEIAAEEAEEAMDAFVEAAKKAAAEVAQVAAEIASVMGDALSDAIRGGLQGMIRGLLTQPTVESAAEALELAQLRLQEFNLEAAAETGRLRREGVIAGLEAQLDALRESGLDTGAFDTQIAAAQQELARLRPLFRALRDQGLMDAFLDVGRQIAAQEGIISDAEQGIADLTSAWEEEQRQLQDRIDLIRESISTTERELEQVRDQIAAILLLSEQRGLELDVIAAQALVANELLLTDAELIEAMEDQVDLIAAMSDALANMADDGWAVVDVLTAMRLGMVDLAQAIVDLLHVLANPVPLALATPALLSAETGTGGGTSMAAAFAVPAIIQNITNNTTIKSDSPAEIENMMEAVSMDQARRLAAEGF